MTKKHAKAGNGYTTLTAETDIWVEPDTESEIVGHLEEGAKVAIYDHCSGWMKVKEGWIPCAADEQPEAPAPPVVYDLYRVAAYSGTNLYSEPNRASAVTGVLPLGADVEAMKTGKEWLQTERGWVLRSRVRKV
ncbi:MAG: SH3 domain-containing protein [Coriobacteriales bacterium]|nr:SH3 domain-containing protein [Coriobacteriales bacterium]